MERRGALPLPPSASPRILVIILRYIGDTLLMTPVLTALRHHYPAARLSAMVLRGTEDVLKHNSDLDEIIVYEKRGPLHLLALLHRLRRQRFDCVIDLTDSDRGAIASFATGAAVRVGFNVEQLRRGRLYTHQLTQPQAGIHRIERNLAALTAIGLAPGVTLPVLQCSRDEDARAEGVLQSIGIPMENRAPIILLQPGARYGPKAWPEARFAELTDRLAPHGHVVIGSSPSEQGLAQRIIDMSRAPIRPSSVCTSLATYIAVIRKCAVFVGNDSGPMHIAAALGVPVVALFGPSDPVMWAPSGGPAIVIHKGIDCGRCETISCIQGQTSCMQAITVDEVYTATVRLLSTAGYDTRCA